MPFSITINYRTPPASPSLSSASSQSEDLTDAVFMTLIDEFYRRCRELGVFCAKDWQCCQTCGHSSLDDIGHRNYIFYHSQDGDRLRDGETECHFAFHFEDEDVKDKVKGIVTELGGAWDGDERRRILLTLNTPTTPPILRG